MIEDNNKLQKDSEQEDNDKCSWCSERRTVWLMNQPFCERCSKEFISLHELTPRSVAKL